MIKKIIRALGFVSKKALQDETLSLRCTLADHSRTALEKFEDLELCYKELRKEVNKIKSDLDFLYKSKPAKPRTRGKKVTTVS